MLRCGPIMLVMQIRCIFLAVMMGGLITGLAEVIQLRDKAAIVGKILAEKKDQVVVDLGYTVVVVPKNQIVGVTKEAAPDTRSQQSLRSQPPPKNNSAPPPLAKTPSPELFQGGNTSASDKSVRELVNELGEAVVQVRTPGGMGSGFFINEDGYLITNFHVIEGETQISVEVYHQQDGQLDRKLYKNVRIVAMNKFQDITLLKIEDKDAQ